MGLAPPQWDVVTAVLAFIGRSVFLLAGAGMVSGTFPCYVSSDAALQMIFDHDAVAPKAWAALQCQRLRLDGP